MIRKKKGNIEWLEFEQLQPYSYLVHGVFLRHGGVSQFPYNSLNFGGGSGDDPKAIARNRELAQEVLGIKRLISSFQVHGDQVISVSSKEELTGEHDGIITYERNMGLLVKHGDCQAAIFFDPVKNIIANVHCGWRGSVKNIYAKTVEYLKERYQSLPEDLLVCISPSLGPQYSEFVNHRIELPRKFHPFQFRENYFDFWEISKTQLLSAGILNQNIEIAELCTFTEKNDFFSHRREKKTGRNGTIVALKA